MIAEPGTASDHMLSVLRSAIPQCGTDPAATRSIIHEANWTTTYFQVICSSYCSDAVLECTSSTTLNDQLIVPGALKGYDIAALSITFARLWSRR